VIFKRKQWCEAHSELQHEYYALGVYQRELARNPGNEKAAQYLRCAEERIKRLKNIISNENEDCL